MSKPKDTITNFWVSDINQLCNKLQLETIEPEDFLNLTVNNSNELLTLTVICKSKTLVLALDDSNKKLSGGWKHN